MLHDNDETPLEETPPPPALPFSTFAESTLPPPTFATSDLEELLPPPLPPPPAFAEPTLPPPVLDDPTPVEPTFAVSLWSGGRPIPRDGDGIDSRPPSLLGRATWAFAVAAAVAVAMFVTGDYATNADVFEERAVDDVGVVRCKSEPAVAHVPETLVAYSCPKGGRFVCKTHQCWVYEWGNPLDWRVVNEGDDVGLLEEVDYNFVEGEGAGVNPLMPGEVAPR